MHLPIVFCWEHPWIFAAKVREEADAVCVVAHRVVYYDVVGSTFLHEHPTALVVLQTAATHHHVLREAIQIHPVAEVVVQVAVSDQYLLTRKPMPDSAVGTKALDVPYLNSCAGSVKVNVPSRRNALPPTP